MDNCPLCGALVKGDECNCSGADMESDLCWLVAVPSKEIIAGKMRLGIVEAEFWAAKTIQELKKLLTHPQLRTIFVITDRLAKEPSWGRGARVVKFIAGEDLSCYEQLGWEDNE